MVDDIYTILFYKSSLLFSKIFISVEFQYYSTVISPKKRINKHRNIEIILIKIMSNAQKKKSTLDFFFFTYIHSNFLFSHKCLKESMVWGFFSCICFLVG